VAVIGKIVHMEKIHNYIHDEKQYTKHRTHKIENKHTKKEKNKKGIN